jgi:hypothetical protein
LVFFLKETLSLSTNLKWPNRNNCGTQTTFFLQAEINYSFTVEEVSKRI